MEKDLICIVCPIGCHLHISGDGDQMIVSGNGCPRGAIYGKQETICPMRTLTTTVRIHHAIHPLLPIITSDSVPKHKIFDIMKTVNQLSVEAPIKAGTCIVKDIANSGVDLVATRTMERVYEDNQSVGNSGYPRP